MDRREHFEAMYVAHCAAVRSFVHRRISAEVADDVLADVFLAAWRRFDEAPDHLLPWLLGIARGVLANARRARARRFALDERLIAADRDEFDPVSDRNLDVPPVLEGLASLSERDQEILLLIAWEGLEPHDAAKVLGISSPQFAVRLHRARRRLRRALATLETKPTSERHLNSTEAF